MANDHIIIIGAGAAGLMAAKELSGKGKKITVLEARNYLGGRIHTVYDAPFATHAELGPEFVHGDLPVTLGLLKEAGIPYHKTGGEMWQAKDGTLKQEYRQIPHWHLFEERLKTLEKDMTINEFLDEHFKEEKHADIREYARRYVAGYDTADPAKASSFALRDEWLGEEHGDTHMPDTGYQPMISYLANKCITNGGSIQTNSPVKTIRWAKNTVSVITDNGSVYEGNKVIITVPLGVLQASEGEQGAISFSPALPEIKEAINNMAIGAVIKILLQFSEPFWENEEITRRAGKSMEKMGFIISQQPIPTFWTQYPAKNLLLTGWLGGPTAAALKDTNDEKILEMTIDSLANIFSMPAAELTKLITTSKVINWTADVYSRGSYSYATIKTNAARKILCSPVENTIFFAGEAMYEGPEMGTVEAALASGKSVAEQIN